MATATDKPQQSSKKHAARKVSKFFRVGVEGATTDGRTIERKDIEQMGRNYDPDLYGSRVWMEHYRGMLPDGPFRAYGDIVETKAEEVEIGGKKKLALFARIAPLPELEEMTAKGQKIYSSMEISPKFADTGEAYLSGLGVTDSPASMGTEVLTFAQKNPGLFASRKSEKDMLFSEAVEVELEFEDASEPADEGGGKFAAALRGVLDKFTKRGAGDDARFDALLQGMSELGDAIADQFKALSNEREQARKEFTALQREVAELGEKFKQIDTSDANKFTQRPAATGEKNQGQALTNC
ncbi:GPO family capsid scaffolding protein [Leptospira sp. 96542]|nr:GPO family capsid scaffolding protein [Leptospira sp. 96542]